MDPMEQIAAIFQADVGEQLDALGQLVDSLPRLEGAARRKAVERCMRIAHNVKGIAASVGYQEIRELAHAAETALGAQLGEAPPPVEPVAAAILDSITAMQQSAQGRPLGGAALSALLSRLTGAPPASEAPESPKPDEAAPAAGASEAGAPAAASVRVEAARLDTLMLYTGELLATHARMAARDERLQRLRETLHQKLAGLSAEGRAEMGAVAGELEEILDLDRRELSGFGRLTRDLGDALKRVRMMRLDGLAPSWRQLVRESAQQLGIRVELGVEVGEIEVDKYVLDRIRDPLIHLLRNAVAHGIEPGPERIVKGKEPSGRLLVSASLHGAQVCLEVCDDGRGLDEQRIGEAALRKGLVDAARLSRLSGAEVRALIFEEGFSTAEAVGPVSGRGVGLNVVKANVAQLGGTLEVRPTSRLGGAGFQMTLPVTVVSRRGLLVRAGAGVYALPIEHVQRTVRVALSSLEQVDGEAVIRSGGAEPIRLRTLAQLMGQRAANATGLGKVVVLERGSARLGLAVDEVLREEEYVVKPLPANLAGVPGVDGAVILADGALATAVDVAGLLGLASAAPAGPEQPTAGAEKPRRRRILVVDDMLTARAVNRGILEGAGHEVGLAADGEEAWALLQREPFDLVVSDVQMPRLDGLALTRRVRADARLRELPVILVTSLGSPDEVAAGMKAGANGYLVKGQFESEKLLATVRRYS